MTRALRTIFGRLGVVGSLLLTLVFSLPAFEAHACADELSPPSASASIDAGADAGEQCPDCGPACASGCCHAPHTAVVPDLAPPAGTLRFLSPVAWMNAFPPAARRPDGPDRPPRT